MSQHPVDPDPIANSVPGCQRRNTQQRMIVDRAIAVQAESSTISAIEYLKAHAIAPQLIERVLLEPARRRSAAHQF